MPVDQKSQPGFIDQTLASQSIFRIALSAMAKPAYKFTVDFASLFKTNPPLPCGVAALALTLADHMTPVWLSKSFLEAGGFLVFHTSASIVKTPEKALLVLAASQDELPSLNELEQGDPRYPDRSATVILANVMEEDSMGMALIADGPGLKEKTLFENHGLKWGFVEEWAVNRASYPLGVDVFLTGTGSLAGLPRSLTLIPKPG
jgi:alpha-D-ribose 1-methylphosphonate 5-triphosphate synthase subunit PhnH